MTTEGVRVRPVPRFEALGVALIAVAVAAALIALSGRYGYHRDELYFLAAGEHLAWGFPDQGPLTPAIAAVMESIAADSFLVLRLPSAIATVALILLSGLIARELGGERRAQLIAAACVAVGVIFLFSGHLLSTTTFDLLAWTALTWIAVRAVRTGDDRLWILAGLVLGIALLNKPSPAFLLLGLLAGVVISGPRRLLRSPWVWAGVVIALAVWAPWLVWQAEHGWPQLEVAENIAAGGSASSQPRWAFLPFQLLLVSPLLAPVWIAGVFALARDPRLRAYRFLAWAWLALALVFIVTGGKPYYLAGLFPALLAAGGIVADEWLERGRHGLRRVALGGAIAASAVIGGAIALPILPADRLEPVVAMNPDVGETVGWPELARSVAEVRARLPHGERVAIFTANYGEAGAIDRFGKDLGLPRAYSGHNGYAEWGTPRSNGPVILVGFGMLAYVESRFRGCRAVARIENDAGIDNDEEGLLIRVCAGPRGPWSRLALDHLG